MASHFQTQGAAADKFECKVTDPNLSQAARAVCLLCAFPEMHGFPDGLFGDFNMLFGTWVFSPQRQKEGIVDWNTETRLHAPNL